MSLLKKRLQVVHQEIFLHYLTVEPGPESDYTEDCYELPLPASQDSLRRASTESGRVVYHQMMLAMMSPR